MVECVNYYDKGRTWKAMANDSEYSRLAKPHKFAAVGPFYPWKLGRTTQVDVRGCLPPLEYGSSRIRKIEHNGISENSLSQIL